MKFGNPLFTSELSGKLGGMVASKARGGVGYFRVRARPGNPRTTLQSTARLILSALAASWVSVLDDTERAAWAGIAPSDSSGIDAYVRANTQLGLAGIAYVDAAPVSASLAVAPMNTITIVSGDNELNFTNVTTNANLRVNVFVSRTPQRSSRLAQQYHTAYAGTKTLNAAGVNTVDLTAVPGMPLPTTGEIFYVRFVQFNTLGQVATEQIARVVCTAP
jgi:hypothetical protein